MCEALRREFSKLFKELTGLTVEETYEKDGWLFIPSGMRLGNKSGEKRARLCELVNYQWKNNLVND